MAKSTVVPPTEAVRGVLHRHCGRAAVRGGAPLAAAGKKNAVAHPVHRARRAAINMDGLPLGGTNMGRAAQVLSSEGDAEVKRAAAVAAEAVVAAAAAGTVPLTWVSARACIRQCGWATRAWACILVLALKAAHPWAVSALRPYFRQYHHGKRKAGAGPQPLGPVGQACRQFTV